LYARCIGIAALVSTLSVNALAQASERATDPPVDTPPFVPTAPSIAAPPGDGPVPDARGTVGADGYPLAGRVGEYFYLRDAHDDFRIYFGGKVHVDAYVPFGPGVSSAAAGSGIEPTVFLRRARPELSGEFLGHWQWTVAGELGRTATADGNGQTDSSSCSVSAKTGALACAVRSAAVQSPSYTAQPTDVFINYRVADALNLEAGQFKIPFSMENRTSENYTPFLESSLPVRTLGAPTLRDIGVMVWGETPRRLVHYEIGVFDGDGPDVTNQDGNFDPIGRVFAHPFALVHGPINTLQIGVSGHVGVRDARTVGYDYPSLTTQEGYAFWRPTYTDSNGNLIHVIPSNRQLTGGVELYWPVSIVDLSSELVVADHDTREARDGYQTAYPYTERYGTMTGYSYYVEAAVWLVGDRQFVRRPGYLDPPHIDFASPLQPSRSSVELLAKFEQLRLDYSSASRGGRADPKSPDGTISASVVSFGVNLWATRRVRLSVNYDLNLFPGSEPVSPSVAGDAKQSSAQRAVAPAQTLASGVNDAAREGAHTLNELSARVAVGF